MDEAMSPEKVWLLIWLNWLFLHPIWFDSGWDSSDRNAQAMGRILILRHYKEDLTRRKSGHFASSIGTSECKSFHVDESYGEMIMVWGFMILKELCYFEDPTKRIHVAEVRNIEFHVVVLWGMDCQRWRVGRGRWSLRVLIMFNNWYPLEQLIKLGRDLVLVGWFVNQNKS